MSRNPSLFTSPNPIAVVFALMPPGRVVTLKPPAPLLRRSKLSEPKLPMIRSASPSLSKSAKATASVALALAGTLVIGLLTMKDTADWRPTYTGLTPFGAPTCELYFSC